MSDMPRLQGPSSPLVIATAGVISGFLYGTAVFGLLFLLPVQVVFGRRGFREGLVAASLALPAALVAQLVPVAAAGGLQALAMSGKDILQFLSIAALPPAAVLTALVLMNAPFWRGPWRNASGLASAVLLALAAIPGVVYLATEGSFLAQLESSYQTFVDGFVAQAGGGVDAEALKSAVDVKTFAQTSMLVFTCAYAAFLYAWLCGSRWLGNRLSGPGSLGRQETVPLAEYRLPYLLVWPFLLAWAGVLGVSWSKLGMPWKAVAWNTALVLSLAYATQGLGIASHLMRRWNLPKSLRICLAVTAGLLAITPPAGPAIAAAFPLLGVSELWIPYRNPKGVTA